MIAEPASAMRGNVIPREVLNFCNTSGESYRAGNFKDRLATMTDAQALAALAADGKLIKRPLVVGDGLALIGFREDEWAGALG